MSKKLTLAQLKRLGACKPALEDFERLFGKSVEITDALADDPEIVRAFGRHIGWAASKLLAEEPLCAFYAAMEEPLRVYNAATEGPRRAFYAATEGPRRAFYAATEGPRRAFEAATEEAERVYAAATEEVRRAFYAAMEEPYRAFDAARARAFIRAFNTQEEAHG